MGIPTRIRGSLASALLVLVGWSSTAHSQGLEYVKSHYTKYEFKIPMRDGVKLFTSVYVPKVADATHVYPILLNRTPYSVGPYGVDVYRADIGPSALFGQAGYIVAYQDVRGRYMSEGEFVNMRPIIGPERGPKEIDESTDTFDTIDWLVKHVSGNSGKVGQWGISYPGFYTACGMIDAHPALLAASPQAPVIDWFIGDDWHHNGAFLVTHAFNFMAAFGHPRPAPTTKGTSRFDYEMPDGYQFFQKLGPLPNADKQVMKGDVAFWLDIMKHGTYDDFWQARNLRPHLKKIRPAVMTVGGWYDAENLFGALECYRSVEANSPGISNTLVMGPWFHGGWSRGDGASLGDVAFNSKTAEFYQREIEFTFFESYLKRNGATARPEAWVFETGLNQWRKHDHWPPSNAKPQDIYFLPDGKLGTTPATAQDEPFDEYVSDPKRPVPYVGFITNQMAREYMVADQRFASTRPDVLVYETAVAENDLTIAGPVEVELFVSTSGTDSDWVVKLIDVYPDQLPSANSEPMSVKLGGYQQLIRGDVMRGKFRESFDSPRAFEPGQPTRVAFKLPDLYHTIRPGHKFMIQVQSTWFPLVDKNPQTFVDIYSATDKDFQKATQRLYHTPDKASKIRLLSIP